uniref:Secreted protein n=1 Tax=Salix viminalis TaxID=40686 RepID=A0A6N2N638_SALVM
MHVLLQLFTPISLTLCVFLEQKPATEYVDVTVTGLYTSIVVDLDSEFVTSLSFLHTFLCYISFALSSPSTVQTSLLRWCLKNKVFNFNNLSGCFLAPCNKIH